MNVVSVDIETTGLDPTRQETWEVAVVPVDAPDAALCYQLPVTLVGADAQALDIGRFYNRYTWPRGGEATNRFADGDGRVPLDEALGKVASALNGAQLLGCSVHFDANFLAELLRRHSYKPRWHHRYLDLGSFTAGAWGAKQALSSKAMSDRYPNEDAHDALADARWNVEVYNAIVSD